MRARVCRQRGSNGLFLPLNVRWNGNAGRLDDVNDVDANVWTILDDLWGNVLSDVAYDDGGNDDAVRAADVFENTPPLDFPLLHGVCCAAPMTILLALGMMNPVVIILVTIVIAAEKLLPRPAIVARFVGISAIIAGVVSFCATDNSLKSFLM